MTQRFNHLDQPVGPSLSGWAAPSHPPREPLEGYFCRLEPLLFKRHAEGLFAANALDKDGRSWTYLPYGPFDTFENFQIWMEHTCLSGDPLFFVIIERSTNKPVGVASYLRISPEAGSIEVGHIHYSEYLKKTPAATEAMYVMMLQAFELGYRRYEWKCDALNAASRKAAQRLGFSYEGTFRQATVYKKRNRDTAWYAVVDSEWPVLKDAFLQWLDPGNFDEHGKQRSRLSELTQHILKNQG